MAEAGEMKLSAERRWWLSRFERGGWTMGRPMDAGKKKWAEHSRMLVKAGLLEAHPNDNPQWGSARSYRITDAGLAALAQSTSQGK